MTTCKDCGAEVEDLSDQEKLDRHTPYELGTDRRHTLIVCLKRQVEILRAERKNGMILSGWNCASCLAFNGEEKEPRETCRSCGSVRKTFGLPLDSIMNYIRSLEANLQKAQECGTSFHNEIVLLRAGKCLDVIPDTVIACGEGGNYCSETCRARAHIKDLNDAAQALLWFVHEEAHYPLAYGGKFRELIRALQKATLNR